jgi:beta-glucosidase
LPNEKASTPRPIRQLEGFERISLKQGESKTVEFTIQPRQFSIINKKGKRVIEPGWFTVSNGGKATGFQGLSRSSVHTGSYTTDQTDREGNALRKLT